MSTLLERWMEYGHRRRPVDIGASFGGHRLGELEDEVQDVVGSYFGMGHLEPNPTARLGLALARLAEVMPLVPTGDTRDYLFLLQDLARQTLERVADGRGPLE